MMDQYAKFLKMAMERPWRPPVSSLNYLASSTLWRQEHNGFSHQNPGLINTLLNKKGTIARVYFPPDANCLLATAVHCLRSKNHINLIHASKHDTPQWLSMVEAIEHCRAGASIWKWASTFDGVDPDVVLVGVGVEPTVEVIAAAYMLASEMPQLRVRVVNVTDLLVLQRDSAHPHGLSDSMFDSLFTPDRPVVINFHGYPSAVHQLLFGRQNTLQNEGKLVQRFHVNGYIEEGTTTTPFHMLVCNLCSRFHVAIQALELGGLYNRAAAADACSLVSRYKYDIKAHLEYIVEHGNDPKEVSKFWEGEEVAPDSATPGSKVLSSVLSFVKDVKKGDGPISTILQKHREEKLAASPANI